MTSPVNMALCSVMAFGLLACSNETASQSSAEAPRDEVDTQTSTSSETIETVSEETPTTEPTPSETTTEVRSADAHVHGDAELAVVLEDDLITLEFESPLYNLLGFEHAPETEAQKSAVKAAEARLLQGETLFDFTATAQCDFNPLSEDIVLFAEASDHGHDHEDDHHEADHKHEEDDHHKHEDNHDDHESEDHADHAHKDVIVSYNFTCGAPDRLSEITVNLFDFFENLSELDVVYLGPSVQTQATLNARRMTMDISQ